MSGYSRYLVRVNRQPLRFKINNIDHIQIMANLSCSQAPRIFNQIKEWILPMALSIKTKITTIYTNGETNKLEWIRRFNKTKNYTN